jgi:hypothetical protein
MADPGTAELQLGFAMADPGTAELQLGIRRTDTSPTTPEPRRRRTEPESTNQEFIHPLTDRKNAELELGGPREPILEYRAVTIG